MRAAICAAAACLALGLAGSTLAADAAAGEHWVAAWYSPPFPTTAVWSCNQVRTFSHETVRQVVRLEAAGDRVRIRLTNELGLEPVQFGEVHVALSSPNGVTEPGTDRAVTFGGKPGAIIPSGQALVSDPVDLKVRRFQELAISVYYPTGAAPAGHLSELEISSPGARDRIGLGAGKPRAVSGTRERCRRRDPIAGKGAGGVR